MIIEVTLGDVSVDYGQEKETRLPDFAQSPGSEVRRSINWVSEIGDATISTSEWELDGLTGASEVFVTPITSIILSGSSTGTAYNTITTDDGQTFRKSVTVSIREQ